MPGYGKMGGKGKKNLFVLHALTTMQGWVLGLVKDIFFIYQMLFGIFLFYREEQCL